MDLPVKPIHSIPDGQQSNATNRSGIALHRFGGGCRAAAGGGPALGPRLRHEPDPLPARSEPPSPATGESCFRSQKRRAAATRTTTSKDLHHDRAPKIKHLARASPSEPQAEGD